VSAPITVDGNLTADARGRVTRDGTADLTMRVTTRPGPHGTGLRVTGHKVFGRGAAAQAARDARMRQLRRGVRVVLAGVGDMRRGGVIVIEIDTLHTPDIVDVRALVSRGSEVAP